MSHRGRTSRDQACTVLMYTIRVTQAFSLPTPQLRPKFSRGLGGEEGHPTGFLPLLPLMGTNLIPGHHHRPKYPGKYSWLITLQTLHFSLTATRGDKSEGELIPLAKKTPLYPILCRGRFALHLRTVQTIMSR